MPRKCLGNAMKMPRKCTENAQKMETGKVCNLALLTLLPLVFTPVVLLLAPPLRAPSPPPCPSGQKLVLDFDTHAVTRHASSIVVDVRLLCVEHRQHKPC